MASYNFAVNEAVKIEDPFHHHNKYNCNITTSSDGVIFSDMSNTNCSSHLRLEIEAYKKEIERLKNEYKITNTNQLSMIESLQQENEKLNNQTKNKHNKLKQYKRKLSSIEMQLKYKNDQVMRLTQKLDSDLHHITTQYLIHEQKKQIQELNDKIKSVQQELNQKIVENDDSSTNNGHYKHENGWFYGYDTMCLMLNILKSKYNG